MTVGVSDSVGRLLPTNVTSVSETLNQSVTLCYASLLLDVCMPCTGLDFRAWPDLLDVWTPCVGLDFSAWPDLLDVWTPCVGLDFRAWPDPFISCIAIRGPARPVHVWPGPFTSGRCIYNFTISAYTQCSYFSGDN